MRKHVKILHQHVRYVCNVCAKEYTAQVIFRKHLLTHISVETQRVKCEECSCTFKNVFRLRKHLCIHEKLATELKCPQCPEKLLNKYLMKSHIRKKHKKKQLHQCHLCGREFRISTELKVRVSQLKMKLMVRIEKKKKI